MTSLKTVLLGLAVWIMTASVTSAQAQEIARVNLLDGPASQSPAFMDDYRHQFLRSFANTPGVDPKSVALLGDPLIRKEHNPYKLADLVKAQQISLQSLRSAKIGLVAITVPHGASLELLNPDTGEYRVHLSFPSYSGIDKSQAIGLNLSISKGQSRHNESMSFALSFDGRAKSDIRKTVGNARARQIEEIIGSKRQGSGFIELPVTYYVKLVSGKIDHVDDVTVSAVIDVQIVSAELATGDASKVTPLFSLEGKEIQEPIPKVKSGYALPGSF